MVSWSIIIVCVCGQGGRGVDGCHLQARNSQGTRRKRQQRKHTYNTLPRHVPIRGEERPTAEAAGHSLPVVSNTHGIYPPAPYVVAGKRATETIKCI